MSIRTKILSILVLATVLYTGLNSVIQHYFILPSFLQLESDEAEQSMQRCRNALRRELYHLDKLCWDWSAWDDAYFYVVDHNPAFEASNLVSTSFSENNLNLIYLFDTEGRVVWGKTYNMAFEETAPPEQFAQSRWPLTHPLLAHGSRTNSVSGIMMTSYAPLLVASRPIVPSVGEGEPHGTFLMGRFLSEGLQETLREQSQSNLSVWRLDNTRLPRPAKAALRMLSAENPTHVEETSQEALDIYTAIPDIFGKPAVLFSINMPRDILRRGESAMRFNLAAVSCAGMVVLLILVILMRRTVTQPLYSLTRHVTQIGRGAELATLPGPRSRDEIGILAREFNRMIRRLRADMTHRAKAEEALRTSENRLRTILATAPDGILTGGANACIETINPAGAHIFGYEPEELIGQPVITLLPASYHEPLAMAIAAYLSAGTRPGFAGGLEIVGRKRDGSEFPLYVRASAVRDEEQITFIGMMRDVSDIKAMQERVLRAERLAAIGEMGASIAHEIRNPLAGISGAVQVLVQDMPQDHKDRPVLVEVLAMVARVEQIVRQVLELARQWKPDRSPCNLLELARNVSEDFIHWKEKPTITLSFSGDEALIAQADPALIQQVIINILMNALDAMPEGGTLYWTAYETDAHVALELKDSGSGMPEEVLKSVFRPFYTTKTRGTGLGLPMCQRIMEAHGGAIVLDSAAGAGTKVTLLLPKGE